MISKELEKTLNFAVQVAHEARHEFVTTEHLLLALLDNGASRHGETLWAVSPLENRSVEVRVGPACSYDREGGRLRA